MNAFDRALDRSVIAALDRARDAMRMREPDSSWNDLCRTVDPAAVIRDLQRERLRGAAEEVTRELDKRRQRESGNSCWLPWETLAYHAHRYRMAQQQTRADVVGTTTAGGYLVSTINFANAAQALLSMLVLGRLGATAVDATGPNLNLPKVTASATPYWLSTETSQVTESDQTFGQLAFSPHTVGGYTELSHLLGLQSRPDAAGVVSNDLARKLAREIERVAFAGTGIAGQPKGLTGLSGINAVSGASFAVATACNAATATGDALVDDASPGWATTRAVASLLRQRQEFSAAGARTIWTGKLTFGEIADFPAAATTGIASGTAFFGCWRYFVLVNWAGGLEIAVNPYQQTNFQSGIVGMRALATLDVGTVWPAAFSAVTGIT